MIDNKVYAIRYSVSEVIYVEIFTIHEKYRGRGYSYRIFNNLRKKYNKPIFLQCWPTLLEYYKKLGFVEDGRTVDGYVEMELPLN